MHHGIAALADNRRLALGTVGSTNDEAAVHAQGGDPGNLWITAERQTRGRGRRGAAWESEPGNLYASLLLRPQNDSAADPQLPLVAAVALHDAIALAAGPALGGRLRIKWPNDLLLDGRKVSGILAEAGSAGGGRYVAIGFGVNCAHAPAGLEATSLAASGRPVGPNDLFDALARAFAARYAEWAGGANFAAIRKAWLQRSVGRNRPIRVCLPEGALDGVFVSLDEAGLLILRTDGGERRISAGDVFFGDTATERGIPA